MIHFPATAKPHEISVMLVYLNEVRDPHMIARYLHYKSPKPVQRVLQLHRDFLTKALEDMHRTEVHFYRIRNP